MPTAPATFRLQPKPRQQGKSAATLERCKKYRTKAWSELRIEVMARDGMVCQACGQYVLDKGDAHVDHVIPVVEGGTDDVDNLRLMHAACHSKRTAKDHWGKK